MNPDFKAHFEKFEEDKRKKLYELFEIIVHEIPNASQIISYNMPCFRDKVNILYFDGFKNHIGFFPTAYPIEQLKNELGDFKISKGTVQFPYDKALPLEIIKKLIHIRLHQLESKNKS